ncbi:MAG: hypothetical protein IJD78_05020 [Clostridia bacterium]|nr:hypothetical protein [Clostridia bacterium]
MQKIVSLIISFITAISLASEGLPYFLKPTLEIDASITEGEISSRATGFLYGLAQNGVPDEAIVESIDVSSVSQKVIGGLQHPIGDVDDVAPALDDCDYITVYLQDCFDTWYYCHDEIWDMRKSGTYDCVSFVEKRFLPLVREKVTLLSQKNYSDRLVYCPYNETDNAVWFGTLSDDGTWLMFDDAAKQRFYDAWKVTYNLIRTVDSDAVIGGPGYCDYDSFEIRDFLEYCKYNNCLPDVMIYHELGENSSLYWQEHIDDYRSIEKELALSEMPVIVTEYGTMQECGAPADMLKYVVNIEKSGAYANAAYWRLADNLCDTAADNNSPNSNWWLFRWYADMEGYRLQTKIIDILHSDFANVIKYNYKRFHYKGFTGISSLDSQNNKIDVICGGCDYPGNISILNLDEAGFNDKVDIKIECVYYEGLSGIVSSPVIVREYTDKAVFGKLKITLDDIDPTAVYHVTVSKNDGTDKNYRNTRLPFRCEFEEGILSGGAYTYDSAYATTGQQNGMVGGLENIGDSVTVSFDIPESGYYDLSLIFGNSNDGKTPDDRADSYARMTLDGDSSVIAFPNTIKSEYTDKLTLPRYLEKGTHSITFAHEKGTFVVDSLLIKPHPDENTITVLPDADRSINGVKSFLVVAPADGFYEMNIGISAELEIDGADYETNGENTLVYLRRGLNYIDIKTDKDVSCVIYKTENTGFSVSVSPDEMILSDGAVLNERKNGVYVDGISSLGGCTQFTVNAPEKGGYRMTLSYANNDEGGVHSYNVDLIERYITVEVNGRSSILWCRNTYSWDTVKTVTMNVELEAGENVIIFSNDGSNKFNNRESYAPHIYGITINR